MSENKQFKVIETKKHDNKRIYELTNNDISFYNFKEEKLLANMICNELNKRIDEIEHLKQFLKQSYDELKYFTGLFEDNEIDVTVKDLLRNLDLILDNDNMSLPSFFNYLVNENEQLKQDNDIKFWKQECSYQVNLNSVLLNELSNAIRKGYNTSDSFNKYFSIDKIKKEHDELKDKLKR